jgi:hypothetical protein
MNHFHLNQIIDAFHQFPLVRFFAISVLYLTLKPPKFYTLPTSVLLIDLQMYSITESLNFNN